MPGAVAEPKSTPWKVTAHIVEERIKLKQNNSRIALALGNAKIHRPGLYLSAKATFDCGSSLERTQANTTGSNQNSIKAIPSKRVHKVNLKQELWSSQTEKDILKNRLGQIRSSDVSVKTVSKLDSKKLRCACQIAMDVSCSNRSQNPLEKNGNGAKVDKSNKTVALKTVNVKPWANDGLKTIKNVESHPTIDGGDTKDKRRLSRLVSLRQECNDMKNCSSAKTQNLHRTLSCQDEDGTVQQTSQKLLKPGQIVYSHSSVSHDVQLDDNGLSGILLVSSKPPANPRSFQQLLPIHRVKQNMNKPDFTVFERGPRLSVMKPTCHLCTQCRKTFQNVSRVHGPGMESANLTRLKYNVKEREKELLKMENSQFDKTLHNVRFDSDKTSSSEVAHDVIDQSKSKLGETFTLPKLYLTHHSTATDDHQKPSKTRTKKIDTYMTSETCPSATKQCCYKLAKLERLNNTISSQDNKLTKNSAKKSRAQESSSGLLPQAGQLRVLMTPLRGFTPHCSEFPESPMLWRENTEVKDTQMEKEMEKEDLKGEKLIKE